MLSNYVRQSKIATIEAEDARQQAAKALHEQLNCQADARQTELSRLIVEIKEQNPPDLTESCHEEITQYTECPVKQQTPHTKCPSCKKSFETEHSSTILNRTLAVCEICEILVVSYLIWIFNVSPTLP